MGRPSATKAAQQKRAAAMWTTIRFRDVEKRSIGINTDCIPAATSDVGVQAECNEDREIKRKEEEIVARNKGRIGDLESVISALNQENTDLKKKLLDVKSVVMPLSPPPVSSRLCPKSKALLSTISVQIAKMMANNLHMQWGQLYDTIKRLTGISEKSLRRYAAMDTQIKEDDLGRVRRILPKCGRKRGTSSKRECAFRTASSVEESVLYKIRTIVDDLHRFRKIRGRPFNTESSWIVARRRRYLKEINELRNNNHLIFYTDETWVWRGMSHTHDWESTATPAELVNQGPSAPPSRGQRAIITHCLGPDGMVEDVLDIFISKNRNRPEDYHETMDSDRFERWFRKTCEILGRQSHTTGRPVTIILDNAAYHKRKTRKRPSMRDSRTQILNWCSEYSIPGIQSTMTKAGLLCTIAIAVRGREKYFEKFSTEEIAEEHGVNVLFLPPFHCRLNPIEMVWGLLKQSVRKSATMNDTLEQIKGYATDVSKLCSVINCCLKFFTTMDSEVVRHCNENVREVEDEYRMLDEALASRRTTHASVTAEEGQNLDEMEVD
uniref:DDE_3 domain-containing protein n=1 Tax=Steinernema glaseri TaxID=37863 RepID=A0A1I8AG94_9BILA